MKFEGTKVFGLENTLVGMRLPMNKNYEEAQSKCDSVIEHNVDHEFDNNVKAGEKDLDLMKRLIKADVSGGTGQPNSKFLRMIHVQVAITGPLYWWKEMDTYKVGTTANSTSTMHKLANYPITKECFEMDDFIDMDVSVPDVGDYSINSAWNSLISECESLRQKFNETKDKKYWKELIRILPESWLQTRMWDADYATLRNIYKWRKNHKLTEWHSFCGWIEMLPYAKELICE